MKVGRIKQAALVLFAAAALASSLPSPPRHVSKAPRLRAPVPPVASYLLDASKTETKAPDCKATLESDARESTAASLLRCEPAPDVQHVRETSPRTCLVRLGGPPRGPPSAV